MSFTTPATLTVTANAISKTGGTSAWTDASAWGSTSLVNALIFRKRISGVNYDAIIPCAYTSGTSYKVAATWGNPGTQIYLNGTAGVSNSNSSSLQLSSTMQVGADGNGAGQPFGCIKKLNNWSGVMTNARLIELTRLKEFSDEFSDEFTT